MNMNCAKSLTDEVFIVREKRKIDLQELNEQSFTLGDALGINSPAAPEAQKTKHCPLNESSRGNLRSAVIRLTRETKGRAGKVMTRMTGLPTDVSDSLDLVRLIKRELGCGASIEDNAVLFQGDQRERLAVFLRKEGFEKVKTG